MRLLEAAILVALAKGVETSDKLAELLKADKDSISKILEELEAKGLVKRDVKGFIFKKTVYRLTEKGYEMLEEATRRLKDAAKELEELGKRLEKEHQIVETISSSREDFAELITIAPLLSWLGLLDVALMPIILSSLADHEEVDIDDESYDTYIE